MRSRSATALLTLLAITSILAGCSGTGPTSSTPASSPDSAASAGARTPAPATPTNPEATVAPTKGLPSFGASEPLVVFALRTDLGGGIFVMHPDGTGRQQLATDAAPGMYRTPDWSSNGKDVVFVEENAGQLLIAHLDGSPTEVLEACRSRVCDDPAWSPDGTRIAFTANEFSPSGGAPRASEILVLTLTTGAVASVVRLERPLLVQAARWSPDGTELVVQVERMDDEDYETGAAIAVVPVAGGEPHYLTKFDVFAGSPDWSWTTNEIVYAVDLADLQKTPPAETVGMELSAIKPDGSGARQITSIGGGARLHAPRWTPDGESIIAKQYDHNAGGGRLVDPLTGAVTNFVTGLEEARPLFRPLPTS